MKPNSEALLQIPYGKILEKQPAETKALFLAVSKRGLFLFYKDRGFKEERGSDHVF